MRRFGEVWIALGAVAVLAALAALAGARAGRPAAVDGRRSTFISDPYGARGLADALGVLGVRVVRTRHRLADLVSPANSVAPTLAVLDPVAPLSDAEAAAALGWRTTGEVVLAGAGTEAALRCAGYRIDRFFLDSTRVAVPGSTGIGAPWANAVLEPIDDDTVRRPSRPEATLGCRTLVVRSVDTLLNAPAHGPVALRLHPADGGHAVTLVADGRLFRNQQMRSTDAGEFALGLFADRSMVIFDEYHQGYGPSGSLAAAMFAWSLRSPLGWMAWQLAVVGLLLLIAEAVRFGPPRRLIARRRRAPLEHVRALATALAAARGHDVAIGALVRGLARRLRPTRPVPRERWRDWLRDEHDRVPPGSPASGALETLQQLARSGQPASAVLAAATAVEDVWTTMKP